MTGRRFPIAVLSLVALAFVSTLIGYACRTYPFVGGDYAYFLPRLLDSRLHYLAEGFSIQWYTPSFGGGLPAYPNPQHPQFTLAQLYLLAMDPWKACLAANATFILLGFFSGYVCLRRAFAFDATAAALGSILFNANGFVFSHILIGHQGYQAFPLFPALLLALAHPVWPGFIRGLLAALVFAILIHSGGFYLAVIFALSGLLLLPFGSIERFRRLSLPRLFPSLAWAVAFAIPLTASKIHAVLAFMRFFPRIEKDEYLAGPIGGLYGIALQFAGPASVAPFVRLAGENLSGYLMHLQHAARTQGYRIRLWEFDMGLSPALPALLAAGSVWIILRRRRMDLSLSPRRLGWLALTLASVWIVLEFRLAQGFIYPRLQGLPILRSLHINLRFASAFIFPLSLLGAWAFEALSATARPGLKRAFFALAAAITIAAPTGYFAINPAWFNYRYDCAPDVAMDAAIRRGETFPIRELVEKRSEGFPLPMASGASEILSYEPVFGYQLEEFHPEIHPGRVQDSDAGYFNLNNAAGFVFPETNGTRPFERIRENDSANLRRFAEHRQPAWNLPPLQRGLDLAMWIALGAAPLVLAAYFGSSRFPNKNRG